MNRSNLLFVVEDTEGYKFGGYVTSPIEKYNECHDDPHAFLFSLKSKKRFIGMRKFPIVDSSCGISVDLKSNKTFLFVIGNVDIWVNKEESAGSDPPSEIRDASRISETHVLIVSISIFSSGFPHF